MERVSWLQGRAWKNSYLPFEKTRHWLRQSRPIRQHVVAIGLVLTLPVLAFAGYLLWQSSKQNRLLYEERLRQHVGDLATAIDRQLESMVLTLQVLATSPTLDQNDLNEFHDQARRALLGKDLAILVLEPSGQQLMNTRVRYGTPLPVTPDLETLRRTVESRKSQVSNLFVEKISKRPALDVHLPIIRNGSVKYVLVLSFVPELIRDIAVGQADPADWVSGVTDANGMVIARSQRHEQFVNTRLPNELFAKRYEIGILETRNLEGVPVLRAVERINLADWVVAATVPRSTVTAASRRGLTQLLLIGLMLTSLSALLATYLARGLTRNLTALALAGERLGMGLPVAPVTGPIIEANKVGDVLVRAAEQRASAEAHLKEAKRFTEGLLSSAPDLLYIYDLVDRRNVYTGPQLLITLGHKPDDIDQTRTGLVDFFHPDDVGRIEGYHNQIRQAQSNGPFEIEYRFRHANGTWRWLLSRDVVYKRDTDGSVREILGSAQDITARKSNEQALAEHAHRQSILLDITTSLIEAKDRRELVERICQQMSPLLGTDFCASYRYDDVASRLTLVYSIGIPEDQLPGAEQLALSQELCGTVAASNESLVVDWSELADNPKGAFIRDLGVRSYCCQPLTSQSGELLGTFAVGSTTRGAFSPEDVVFLETVANVMSQAWERLDAEEAVRESETRLRSASESAHFGIHEHIVGTGKARWSAELARLMGLGDQEVEVNLAAIPEVLHPDDLERVQSEMQANLRRLGPYEIESRIVRPDGEVRWLMDRGEAVGPIDPKTGMVQRITGTVIDISQRKRDEERLRSASETYLRLIKNAPLGIYLVDGALRIVEVSKGAQKVFENVQPVVGRPLDEVLRIIWPEPLASQAIVQFKKTLDSGETFHAEATERRKDTGELECYDWQIERVSLADGQFGVVCYYYDLTERKLHEQKIELLMREVSHRSKNMLALVDSIARQTAATSPADFLPRLSDRLRALATSLDLLIRNDWQRIELRELVVQQLSTFADLVGTRITVVGSSVLLSAHTAQALGMALHELVTNASKYGALANSSGHIQITWDINDAEFSLSWSEVDGPPVTAPTGKGFGTTVMTTLVEMSLGGATEIDYNPEGIAWRLRCPVTNVVA